MVFKIGDTVYDTDDIDDGNAFGMRQAIEREERGKTERERARERGERDT